MRVAIVCPYAWDRPGGVQTHIRSLSVALRGRGHEVRVFAPLSLRSKARPAQDDPGMTAVGRAIGIPANGSIAPITFGPIAALRIRSALSGFHPDVIHLHEPLIPSLSLLALLSTSTPAVGTFHAAAPSSPLYGAFKHVLSKVSDRLSARTAVSGAAARLITRYFGNDLLSTPNGIDLARFLTPEPIDLDPGQHVLFLGRLEPRKGPDVLVRAMELLGDLDVQLVIAGSGGLRSRLQSAADRAGTNVRFLGEVSERDKPGLFASCELYCAPNLGGESFGIVLLEAMASGCPVVCSGLEEFRSVAGDAAAFTPAGDPVRLAETIRGLLSDPEWRAELRSRGSERVMTFDWARLVVGVEHAYEHALGSHKEK